MIEEFHLVTRNTTSLVEVFMTLGKDYMNQTAENKREIFLQSMVDLQGQPNRWLLLYENKKEYVGFAHVRYGGDRPDWGWILEFYIKPECRRKGLGTQLYDKCESILREKNASSFWLTTNPEAVKFWESLGYEKMGVIAEFNDYEIMEKHIPKS